MQNYIYVFTLIRKHKKFCAWWAQSIFLILVFHCSVLTEPFSWFEESRVGQMYENIVGKNKVIRLNTFLKEGMTKLMQVLRMFGDSKS